MSEKFYQMVVCILAILGMTSMAGYVVLAAYSSKGAPDALLNLAFTAIGALGGTLAQPEEKKSHEGNEISTLEQLAAKTIIAELMKQSGMSD